MTMSAITGPQSLAIDPRSFSAASVAQNPAARLEQAAAQFEAIFLQLVLQNMHSGTDAIAGENGFFSGKEAATFRDMHDAQLAQQLAGAKQLGLADAIVRQLGEGLAQSENKFKQLSDAVALPQEGALTLVAPAYSNQAFSQPLWRTEDSGNNNL